MNVMLKGYPSRFILLSILLSGSFIILFVTSFPTNAFSQATESFSKGDPFLNSNVTGLEPSYNSKMDLLKALGLYTIFQPLEGELSKIMDIAYQSMNLTNSFGTFP